MTKLVYFDKMKYVLKADNVVKDFRDFRLDNIHINIENGELYGFLGPNGSGKTTLIKILTGQIKPDEGSIKIVGINPVKNPLDVKKKIGIIPEQENPPSFMTVQEYLEFIANIRGIKNPEIDIEEWLEFFEFKHQRDYLIKDLSRGTKQKLLAIQAFIHKPKLVFIDEPLINLDPAMQKKFKDFLVDYVGQNNTVFLSTHVLSIAEEIATRVAIVKKGRIITDKKIGDIKTNLEKYFIEETQNG